MKHVLTFLYLIFLHSSVSTAAVIINMFEKDGGVVATATGSINTNGLTRTDRRTTVVNEGSFRGNLGFAALNGSIFVGQGGGSVDEYIIETTHAFSTGPNWTSQSSSGDHVGINSRSDSGDTITLPKGYTSGAHISGTSTWPDHQGATLAAMQAIPGTYVFAWGSGPTADSITLNIGSAPPPENSFPGELPSGRDGTLSFTSSDPGCAFASGPDEPEFLSEDEVGAPPENIGSTFDGVVKFKVEGCTPGATVNFSMDYGIELPAGTTYWKVADPWYEIEGATITGRVVEFSITDGGPNDQDRALGPNGTIIDPSGAVLAPVSATEVFSDGFED